MKRLLFTTVLVLCAFTYMFAQASMSGSGTASDPYKIYYPDQLHQVRNYLNQSGVVFKLMNDIDITEWNTANNPGQGWEPIGVESSPFKGVFDGNNKTISGFSITRSTTNYVGFFGCISGATIKNLTIEGPVTGKNYVGAFVGKGVGNNTLTGLTHNGDVSGAGFVGHIAGSLRGAISNATATGNVTGSTSDSYLGGIVGYSEGTNETTINNAQMTGNITCSSASYVGGIAGKSTNPISNANYSGTIQGGQVTGGIVGNATAAVSNATTNGTVKGSSNVGGIVGQSDDAALTSCYSTCNVTGTGGCVGGVMGKGYANISHCSSFGNVSGSSSVGGVIGYYKVNKTDEIPELCRYHHTITNAYGTEHEYYTDKIISSTEGETKYSITNCYAVGNVVANTWAGGICGKAENSYDIWKQTIQTSVRVGTSTSSNEYKNWTKTCKGETQQLNITYEGDYLTIYNYSAVSYNVSFTDNYFSGNLQGGQYTGGVIGQAVKVSVTNNYSNANITGTQYVGGIVGEIMTTSENLSYYDYDSSTPKTKLTVAPVCYLKSNMAINNSIIATSDAGRIYGNIGASKVTVGTNGNAAEDNRALYEGRLVLSGVTQEVVDSEKDGVNNGVAYFKLKANYISHGWDFNDNWKNLDTETYPYKPWQAAPPTVSSGTLISGNTSISGNSTDGGTVYIKIGNNTEKSITCSGTSWTLSNIPALKSGEDVSLYTKVSGKENSYRTLATVSFLGSGTESDPWRIYTAYDLQGVYKAGYYKQMNDINLASWISANSSTAGWVPVGYNGTDPVVYDGDNHKVTGLWINTTEDYTGLFSRFSSGTIRNLTVEATSKQVKGGNYTGIVIGRIGTGTIQNVTATGNVSAKGYVGGIAGYTEGTTLSQLHYSGRLTATGYVGGITSYAKNSTITECEATNLIINASSSLYVGGIVSYYFSTVSNSTFSKCKVTGTINLTGTHSGARVGGLVGDFDGNINECSTDVTINSASPSGFTAGLVACNNGDVKSCYASGSITSTGSNAYTGGLVAVNGNAVIEDCYSTANVTGTQWTAGLVAHNYKKVNRCYASGDVSSVYYGAGLVCENDGSLAITTNCVALNSKVEVSDQTGWGLRVVGNFKNGASEPDKDNLYAWQGMQVSVNGVPKSIPDNNLDGTAITTEQTKDRDTYESLYWDFDEVWAMPTNAYPQLQWLYPPSVTKGDLNGDGSVSISDVVLIIDVMAGTITDADKVAAADVNNDGNVSITDCVAAIDLIAAQQSNAPGMTMAPARHSQTDFISASMQDGELSIALDNERSYTAFQMLVSMPEGMSLCKAMMDEARSEGHQVTVRSLGNGQYLIAGFSIDNEVLAGNSGRLLTIATDGKATGEMVISNVEFATAQAEGYQLATIMVTATPTGITDYNSESITNDRWYDLQGRHIGNLSPLTSHPSPLKKGIYIVNGKKIAIKYIVRYKK